MTKQTKILFGVLVIGLIIFNIMQKNRHEEYQQAEAARVAALTPEQRAKEAKQKEFEDTRRYYGQLLTKQLKATAFDSDALKINSPVELENGVCVSANGKNRFGAYVGWKDYCYLVNNKGVWTLKE